MSRMTDEELAEFTKALEVHREVIHPEVLGRSTFTTRVSFVQMEAMIAELKERRQRDFELDEYEASNLLRAAVERVRDMWSLV